MSEAEQQSTGQLSAANRRKLIVAIAVYIALLCGLIGGYIHVSTMDIQLSSYVHAANPMIAGKPNAARGFILNAPTGRMFGRAKVEFEIDGKLLGDSETGGHGFFHSQITPPKAGKFQAVFRATHPHFETYEIPLELEVQPATEQAGWPSQTSRLPRDKQGWRAKSKKFSGELDVDIFPENRELLRGLPNLIYVRVRRKDTGAPVKARVNFTKVEGLAEGKVPTELVTDAAGLVAIKIKPVGSQVWTTRAVSIEAPLNANEAAPLEAGEGKLGLATVASQFSMDLESLIIPAGGVVRGWVTSLHRSGGLMVDLYDPHTWVAADAFGISPEGGGFEVRLPRGAGKTGQGAHLYRVQVYNSVFDAGNAWDSRYVVASNDSCPQVLTDVLKLLPSVDEARLGGWSRSLLATGEVREGMKGNTCKKWLEAALMAIPAHFESPPQLINNQVDEREELAAWKEGVKSNLFALIIIALLLGFAGILWAVANGYKTAMQQRQALLEVELELADEPSFDASKIDQFMQVVRVVMLIITFVLFASGVVLVLSFL